MPNKKKLKDNCYSGSNTHKGDNENISASKVSHTKKLVLLIGKIIMTIMAIWGAWVTLTPRVFVYSAIALDPTNPVLTPFVVRNEGYLSIRDVKFSCSMKYI